MNGQRPQLEMDTPVQFVKGVGPVRAEQLNKCGIETAGDLLNYFPRRFDLLKQVQPISTLNESDTNVTIAGTVTETKFVPARNRPFFTCSVEDDSGSIDLVWFHGQYLIKQIRNGMQIAANGAVKPSKNYGFQIINPQWRPIDSNELPDGDTLKPVYPATAGLSSNVISSVVRKALDELVKAVPEKYDGEFLESRALMPRRKAYLAMHHPEDSEQWSRARRRMAYDECMLMQLALGINRLKAISRPAISIAVSAQVDKRIRARMPFKLTEAQDRVIGEICGDIGREKPMNRLLQGDVGCGKTVVALYAALTAIARRYQVTIMAPTEILAEQHYRKICDYLSGSQVNVALLTGSLPAKKRKYILARCANGELDLVIGTHALLSEGVKFKKLALVIVDEQHKFGVQQRGAIRGKGFAPHYLVMTATPIPRTLAMTVFGDLDVSVIDSLPPGRGKTETRHVKPRDFEKVLDFVRQKLTEGRQAYIIYPLVNPSADTELKTAIEAHENLSKSPQLAGFNVSLVHGGLSSADKHSVMQSFAEGKTHVLVASVVVEVGVDVPNASVMVIEHAERFGLAQLHQLRGRVGRGSDNAWCILVGRPSTPIGEQRLEVMCKTNDGFEIAEEDLRLRGPGEFFGARQHGLPELKVADLVEDFELLRLARRDASYILGEDPTLSLPHNQQLRTELFKLYADRLNMIDGA